MSATASEVAAVYAERNAVVCALARAMHAAGSTVGWARDERDETGGWPVLYIDTPAGQVSWHLPKDELPEWVEPYEGSWDGHTTAEKYARLARLGV